MSTHSLDTDLQLTRRIGFADLHSDLPLGLLKRRFDGSEGSLATEWLPRLRAGGVNLVVWAAYIERITAEGRIAAILAFEGAEPLGQDLAALRLFYRLGMRMLSFAWMRRTAFGDGAWENESRGGLTRLGRQAVREMNRLGIVADV